MLADKWDSLPDEIRDELRDPEFGLRQHYSRATYALGCRGPLCRKAERDRGRNRNEMKAADAGREYSPNHEHRTQDPDEIEEIIEWHIEEIAERRLAARAS